MSFKEYVRSYPSYHRHPLNKALHLFGIPLIIMGMIFLVTSPWPWGVSLISAGSFFLWLGHKVEGNKPALTTNPIYILAAPIWYVQMIRQFLASDKKKSDLVSILLILSLAGPGIAVTKKHRKEEGKATTPSTGKTSPSTPELRARELAPPYNPDTQKDRLEEESRAIKGTAQKTSCEQKHSIETFVQISSASSPQSSKTGVYFLSDLREVPQVFHLSSPMSWPEQISFFPDGVAYFRVSPNTEKILLATHVGGDEQYDIYLLEPQKKKLTPLLVDREVRIQSVAWSPDSKWFAYTSNQRNKTDMDLYRYDLETNQSSLLVELNGHHSVTDISPNGRLIAVTHYRSVTDSDVLVWDLSNQTLTNLTKHTDEAFFSGGKFAADSKNIFLVSDFEKGVGQLYVLALNRPKAKKALTTGPWEIEEFQLNLPRSALVYLVNEQGYSRFDGFGIAPFGAKKGRLVLPKMSSAIGSGIDFSRGKTTDFFFSKTGSNIPAGIWAWQSTNSGIGKEMEWTQTNPRLLNPECFTKEKLVHFQSFDGLEIPAFLYQPRDTSGPIPFIVYVHGGPEAQFRPAFNKIFQYFLERGFGVFAPNIRGSTGYGRDYTLLDNYKKRMDSVKDVTEGAKWLVTNRYAKAGQLAIFGGSYGGFLVLRSIQLEPELFAAASESVGISNFVTFLKNTKSYRRALREIEYGPLSDEAFLKSISPMTYIDKIKTPLLIFHGANDPRVPVSEAEQIIQQLKSREIPVDFKIFSDEGHGNTKLRNIMEQAKQTVYFFEKHMKGP